MRVCMLGDFASEDDEGMRKIAASLAGELSRYHAVLRINPNKVHTPTFWSHIKSFSPHIIHYISGPSLASFLIQKGLLRRCPDAKTVMSFTHPTLGDITWQLASLMKPDLALTQSTQTEDLLRSFGFRVKFLPNGVDIEKFCPASHSRKSALRERFRIEAEDFVVNHVGSIRRRRNILLLSRLLGKKTRVIIVGSPSGGINSTLSAILRRRGCLIFEKFIENIEEVYQLSDCYVFPVKKKKASVETPLSILEAMACGLPIATTKFGALPRLFDDGSGMFFGETDEELVEIVNEIRSGQRASWETREMVTRFSWSSIGRQLNGIYQELAV